MRKTYLLLFIFAIFFFSTQTLFVANVFSATSATINCNIFTTLRMGSRGAEVECLQKKVGATTDGKFGLMTKAYLKDFQLKNKLSPDGVAGPLTRLALSKIVENNNVGSSTNNNNNPQNPPEVVKNTAEKVNPNLANLDKFIETVVRVAKEKGSSEKDVALIAKTLREDIVTNKMNYKEEFKKLLTREASVSLNIKPFSNVFDKFLTKAESFLGIIPHTAHAATGIPFGGSITYIYFCAYNATWMIWITPMAPSYVMLLSYVPGTQGFASYNIPITLWLLGEYEPPGMCIIPAGAYPLTIPTEGFISPMVGSSAL